MDDEAANPYEPNTLEHERWDALRAVEFAFAGSWLGRLLRRLLNRG